MSLAVVVCAGLALSACGPRFERVDALPGDVVEGEVLPTPSEVVNRFAPVRLEVYPLSRLEGAGPARRAVVHLRLQDAFSHDVKWPGVVRIEVVRVDGTTPGGESATGAPSGVSGVGGTGGGGEVVGAVPAGPGVYHVDLTAGEVNARAFDTISRCYALRVPAPGEGPVTIKARWLLRDGEGRPQAMNAQAVLVPPR